MKIKYILNMANNINNSVSGEDVVIATTVNEMEKLVKSFNEMMKEQVRNDFEDAVNTLKESIEEQGQEDTSSEYISLVFDFWYDYEEEWKKFALEQGKVEPSVAIEFYRENEEMFITERKMFDYVYELIDEYDVEYLNSTDDSNVKICVDNPYFEE